MNSNFLYTVTNGRSANAVVGIQVSNGDGLAPVKGSPFLTGGKGSFSSQSQNGVWIDGDVLYAVDFGSNSFAMFHRKADGTLTRLNAKPLDSHGDSPCSLCVSGDTLYVLNQGVRSSGSKAEPSLSVFAVGGGTANYLQASSFNLPRGESPTQVIANAQGTLLAVPSVRSRSSLLHLYRITPGAAGAGLLTELQGSPHAVAGSGFGFGSVWMSDGQTLYMTNATGSGSVVRLSVNATTGQLQEQARAMTPGSACWAVLGRSEKRLYVTNLLSLVTFDVTGGRLTQLQTVPVTDVPKPVLRDLIVEQSGKFVYALEQRKKRILAYAIGGDGLVTPSGELVIGTPGYTLGLAIA